MHPHRVTGLLQEVVVKVRGHEFVEISYHTPSNCDVCNRTLPWSLVKGGQGTYECKRETTHTPNCFDTRILVNRKCVS